jgi:sugar phosphate permease
MTGLLLGLIPWGAAADRYGERLVIVTGVGLAAVVLLASTTVHATVALGLLLALAGLVAASVNAASGRMVMGWFPARQRGLAMGARQTAQPLGVALAALTLPGLAGAHGVSAALWFPGLLCAAAAALVLLLVRDPPRAPRRPGQAAARSPYRGSRHLLRIHLASTGLVVPQFAISTFTLAYLVGQRQWDPVVAGRMIFGFQVAGATGRIAAGVWSDRVGSRLRPIRQLAIISALAMLGVVLGAATHSVLIVVAFAIGAVITVADNGLANTAVAEVAGSDWSGRALGVQNTLQNLAAAATAPLLATVIGHSRYAWGFGLVALIALAAVPLTPVAAEAETVVADERSSAEAASPAVSPAPAP